MHARDLMPKIGKEPLPSVLLFCPGTAPFNKEPWEPVLAERALEAITAHYVDPSVRDLAYTVYHADEVEPGQIVQEAETLPFLADRRVIVVRGAERFFALSSEKGSPLEPLLRYLAAPADTALLLLVASKVDKRVKFYNACKNAGEIVECPQLEDRELAAWIQVQAEAMGKQIGRDATMELIDRAGGRLSDVANALSIVSSFVGAARQIREEDVITACADVAEDTVWSLTDAIARSDMGEALKTLHHLFDLGKVPDEILGTINWLIENAYMAAPDTPYKVKSGYVEKKVMPLVEKWGTAKLRAALALGTDTHFMTRTTGADPKLLVELLVAKLAFPMPTKATRKRA